jgi:hypothetical protein
MSNDPTDIPDDVVERCHGAFSIEWEKPTASGRDAVRAAIAEYERIKAAPPAKVKTRGEIVASDLVQVHPGHGEAYLTFIFAHRPVRFDCVRIAAEDHHLLVEGFAALIDREREDAAREERGECADALNGMKPHPGFCNCSGCDHYHRLAHAIRARGAK